MTDEGGGKSGDESPAGGGGDDAAEGSKRPTWPPRDERRTTMTLTESDVQRLTALESDIHWLPTSDPLIAKKRALAQLVVHDLRNPLSAAHGYVQLAKEELGAGAVDPARVREYLDDVTTLIDKALGLVATILDVEELEDGLLRAHPTEITFAELIRRARAGHTRQYDRRGLSFAAEGVVDAPLLLDVDMIGRVVENLLDNAARYAPRGGRVVASARWIDDNIELAIGNSGPPVPERDRETIFGRYYQLEARRASARANRGLGLYFCKLAVGAHGGTIQVETRGDLGAVFVVRIPCAIAAPPGTAYAPPA